MQYLIELIAKVLVIACLAVILGGTLWAGCRAISSALPPHGAAIVYQPY